MARFALASLRARLASSVRLLYLRSSCGQREKRTRISEGVHTGWWWCGVREKREQHLRQRAIDTQSIGNRDRALIADRVNAEVQVCQRH